MPLLGHIPILGELFKSRNFIDHKTELAILVTPHLISAGSEKVKEIIDDAHESYEKDAVSLSFSVFDESGRREESRDGLRHRRRREGWTGPAAPARGARHH